MSNFRCIVLAVLFGISAATKGFDTVQNLSIDKFQCLKDNGFMFFIGRIWKSSGEFDWDGLQNVKNAFEAGLYVSVYIFPCLDFPKCAPVQYQVEETINRLNDEGVKYGIVFLDIQMFDWPSDKKENRKSIDAMGQKLDAEVNVSKFVFGTYKFSYLASKRKNSSVNVVKSHEYIKRARWVSNGEFTPINATGMVSLETGISGTIKELWWAFWGNNDGERYSDFDPFGGWTDFYMQQYAGDIQGPCSVALDLDYYA